MKKGLLCLALLLFSWAAYSQIIEPEYIGQAYALTEKGERVMLSPEVGYLSINTKAEKHTFSHSYTSGMVTADVWQNFVLASTRATTDGFSVTKIRGKSLNFLNVKGLYSPTQLRILEPFSVVLRLESNDYLPETQLKVVRFILKDGIRYAHEGSSVPFQAVKVGDSSYQIKLDTPWYGEYGIVFKNEMNTVLTFSVGYSDDDVREYVRPFLEPGSVDLMVYMSPETYELIDGIFDRQKNDYVTSTEFGRLYGYDFMQRVIAEYKRMKKIVEKERKAQKKAERRNRRNK